MHGRFYPKTAACACGALGVTVAEPPANVHICSCLECQRRSGSAFTYTAFFPEAAVSVAGEYRSWKRTSDARRFHESNFCPTCGTSVFYRLEAWPGVIGVAGWKLCRSDLCEAGQALLDDATAGLAGDARPTPSSSSGNESLQRQGRDTEATRMIGCAAPTTASPPCRRAICRTSDKPKPGALASSRCSRWNGENTRSRSASGIPAPASITSSTAVSQSRRTSTRTGGAPCRSRILEQVAHQAAQQPRIAVARSPASPSTVQSS